MQTAKQNDATPAQQGRPAIGKELLARFEHANRGDLGALPKINEYSGKKTAVVYTNQAAILDRNRKTDGIYTFFAWSCSVVVATVKSEFTGVVQRVGMLHLSPEGYDENNGAVSDFLKKMKNGAKGNLEITIISGKSELPGLMGGRAERVFADCEKYGKVVFMNSDRHGDREDRVLVDRQGRAYYENGNEPSRFIESWERLKTRVGLAPVDKDFSRTVKYLLVK